MRYSSDMRRHASALLLMALLLTAAVAIGKPKAAGKKTALPDVIYNNGRSPGGFIASGWIGDTSDIHYNPHCTQKPPTGKQCLRIHFSSGSGWGGIVWQNPANNWGNMKGGLNLTGARRLVFWARAKQSGLTVKFGYGLLGKSKTWHDSSTATRHITLTTKWKKYTISLKGKNMSRIITGFYWSAAATGSPFTFYLDGIEYQK